MRRWPLLLAPLLVLAALAPGASATPVATDPQQAALLGRVLQEPLRSTNYLQLTAKVGVEEFAPAFRLLQKLYPRYIHLSTVAAELHDSLAVSTGKDGIAAGAPGDTHDGLPLYVITLTDRQVPDAGKAYVSLMFAHSAEPCGREGVLRSIEDMALSATKTPTATFDDGTGVGGIHRLTAGQILARTKVFVTVTSPDGWAAGDGPGNYSQYNGAGINSNRVAYQPGWVFNDKTLTAHHYTTATQAEGIAVTRYLLHIRATELHGKPFTEGADLHGPLPYGLILQHDQGNSPVKLRRSHDLAQRVKQRMDRVFEQYSTHQGASSYATTASYAASVRDALLAASPTTLGNTTAVEGAGATGQVIAGYPLQWAQYSQIWDLIGYTASAAWGGWMNSALDADSISYEINCGELLPYVAPAQQLFQDNVRAIVQTTLVQAASRATTSYGTDTVTGRIGYYDDGQRTTDADGNPSAVPTGYPSVPLLHQLTQTHYNVSPIDYFRDLRADLGRSLQRVTPATLATALPHLDTLVVADQHVSDTPALKAFVAGGGNLVLTDAALTTLPSLGVGTTGQVQRRLAYVGYADLDRTHPFTRGLSSNARQTYDPIGLGYPVLMERDGYWTCPPTDPKCTSGTHNSAPVWSLPTSALPTGSQVVGTVDPPATPTTTREGSATTQAEIAVIPHGRGRIVTFGALLPHPTEAYPHYYGLQGYSISYAGQQMLLRAMTFSRALTSVTGVMPPTVTGPHGTSPRTTPGLLLPKRQHLATTGAPGGIAAGAFLILAFALGLARCDRRRLNRP